MGSGHRIHSTVVWLWGTLQLSVPAAACPDPRRYLCNIHLVSLASRPTTLSTPPRLPREFELWAPLGPTTAHRTSQTHATLHTMADYEALKDQWSDIEEKDGIRLSWNTFPSSRMVRLATTF